MTTEGPVTIETLAPGGRGVARLGGRTVFVAKAAPGDVATLKVEHESGRVVEASIAELIEAGPSRTEPPCPVFASCGGCQWQHLSYEDQLAWKSRLLAEQARQIAPEMELAIEPVVPAPTALGYRSRIQMAWDPRRRVLGFRRERSHQVVAVVSCPVAHPLIDGLIGRLGEALASLEPPLKLSTAELDASASAGAVRLFVPDAERPKRAQAEALLEAVGPPLSGVVLASRRGRKQAEAGRAALFHTSKGGLKMRQSPGVFWQVNLDMNERLVEEVLREAAPKPGRTVVDLFSGAGNFTLPLALAGAAVVGIEAHCAAVEDARWSFKENSLKGWRLIAADAKEGLRAFATTKGRPPRPDVLIADPPRAGLKGLEASSAALGPERIVYVACEPASLFRDLAAFRSLGYLPSRILPLDLFPHTPHVELVATLDRA